MYIQLYKIKILTSDNIIINRLYPLIIFTILGILLFAIADPLSLFTYFRLRQKWIFATGAKNIVSEITDLLQYWPMIAVFGGKTLKADCLNFESIGEFTKVYTYICIFHVHRCHMFQIHCSVNV